ncbi:MAG: Adaptor for signal transduction [Trizodia sp. TS-e1964]|nr:MAG: Adaptor for signal transduction [Trizodia sp. TS-e1964]
MAFPTPYHEDSDADDEYERSGTSPHLPADSDASPTDSDSPSTEHTPTLFDTTLDDRFPAAIISDWTAEECADYVTSLGLDQYSETFLDNDIVGEALIALKHEELKEMGISSVGHRLTILKSVYDVKIKHEIPIEVDHYIPLCMSLYSLTHHPVIDSVSKCLAADASAQDATATQEDIARLIRSFKLRDERIVQAEAELRRLTEEYQNLKKDLLPVFRMAKDQLQPLPFHPTAPTQEPYANEQPLTSALSPPQGDNSKSVSSLSRKLSTRIFLGSTPKNSSPTHIPPLIQEGRHFPDSSSLDPSAAANAASTHLTASMNGGSAPLVISPGQQNLPSPTSPPAIYTSSQLASRSYGGGSGISSNRGTYTRPEDNLSHVSYSSTVSTVVDRSERSNPNPTPTTARRFEPHSSSHPSSGPPTSGGTPSVEVFKSFRVSMDDPCHKVLPAALKKYNIDADWRQYALYIVYGDQERCLGLEEKPLILFKQLDREGRKPMFMLRRHAAPLEGHSGPLQPGSAGLDALGGSSMSGRGSITVPGGVL